MLGDLLERDEILADFLYETEALLRRLEVDSTAGSNDEIDPVVVGRMIRAAHAIGCASSLLGLPQFGSPAEKAGAMLTRLYHRELTWTPASRRCFFEIIHPLKQHWRRLRSAPAGRPHRHQVFNPAHLVCKI